MEKSLVIVESPTKAKTIEKFLGKNYTVLASYGHVRDLPNSAAEIPASIKKEKWSRLGINTDDKYQPLYIIPEDKKKRVKDLELSLKGAKELLLATDEDREGESISWHLLEVLKPKVPVKRLVFHEITKEAIQHALDTTRDIDENLVRAQETRRIIDRLYGYTVSPLLWKKMAPRLSAGRVQSTALRLLVERERERISFKRAQYWDIKATFEKIEGSGFGEVQADLTHVDGKRVADGKDFDPNTGKLTAKSATGGNVILLDEKLCRELEQKVKASKSKVISIEEKPFTSKPYPPFTTSTLQQEGSRKLGFAARRTMQVAQQLYENGFITYMRTDSTNLSDEAINGARTLIKNEFGAEYLPSEPRIYKTKVKNAQEAHEAVRPAGANFAHPDDVKAKLGQEAFRLYDLIWKRMLACQMKDSEGLSVVVKFEAANAQFRASGKTIKFAGFLRAYVEGSDDPDAEIADKEKILPPLKEGEVLNVLSADSLSHETQPPARYTEGSLIKQLESLGIGRPSTWATIVDVVLSRDYAFKKGTALVPTFLAMAVTNLLEKHFEKVVDYEYTAGLEEDLDRISRGEAEFLDYLNSFFKGDRPGLQNLVTTGEETIDPRVVCGIQIGMSAHGAPIEVRIGKFGPFITDTISKASLPDDTVPEELTEEKAKEILEVASRGPESLGAHPESGKPVYFKTGRFGPYVQEGDSGEDEEKPKMASLLPGMTPEDINLEVAVQLLSLPRTIGKFEGNNEDIVVYNGRYGPYIKAGSETRTLSADLSPITITHEQAVELLKQPRVYGRRGAVQPKSLKEIGKHPVSEKNLVVKSGRYGAYVTDGEINATIPKDITPEEITLDQAVNLINARADKVAAGGGKPKRGRGGSKASGAAKKTTEKKVVEKKTTTTKKTAPKSKTKTKKETDE